MLAVYAHINIIYNTKFYKYCSMYDLSMHIIHDYIHIYIYAYICTYVCTI